MTWDEYHEHFDRTWPWLKKSLDCYGPTHEKEHVWDLLKDGRAQLWPMPNAALITVIDAYPTGHSECRVWVAGGKLSELQQLEPVITAFAKSRNCHRLVIAGRDGWSRLFKGEKKATTIIREL